MSTLVWSNVQELEFTITLLNMAQEESMRDMARSFWVMLETEMPSNSGKPEFEEFLKMTRNVMATHAKLDKARQVFLTELLKAEKEK